MALAWAGIILTDAKTRVEEAKLQDSSRMVIASCLVVAAFAGLFAAALPLHPAKQLDGHGVASHVALAILTVVALSLNLASSLL